ncbi:metal-sulfur cluster biosynthetic enzyme [Paenibacillus phyllosphaerae]|uniref:Metal-sulfur cluster biosynthetic enzyme n=1 Tax=Paenibacillus phyllosphaerae TaxID=274593 RepID=A0A7W5FNB5_9BACL|nr:iron-sulfur cluster assembly protein [Paenibacillus phyllosphaerae]MBB3111161.1 metal-sulfur cluster biosynthetic enzyme [Paenibacillus phyllosphaerae]
MMISEMEINQILKQVYDPELGVNIVDLGLIYDISIGFDQVNINMTLTTPGCPLHDTIIGGVRRSLEGIIAPKQLHVDLVWEPKWAPERMSEAARKQLGII